MAGNRIDSAGMKRVVFRDMPLRVDRSAGLARIARRVLLGLFIAQWMLVCARVCLARPPFGEANWPEGLLLVLAAAATFAGMGRELPLQNVFLSGFIITLLSGAVVSLGAVTGVPFGPLAFGKSFGQQFFYPLPWAALFVWMVVLLNARGVARLLLRAHRAAPGYGLWLMGGTALLAVAFDLGLEPFATRVKHYWIWQLSKTALTWYGAPWVNFFAWGVAALLILAFATPSLNNKKPGPRPPDYQPLALWLLMNGLFVASAVANRFWAAAVVVSVQCLGVALLALLSALHQRRQFAPAISGRS